MQLRHMLRPGTKAHALNAAMDQDVESSGVRHHSSTVGMAGIGVAAGIIVIERLNNALRILRVHSAQDLVDLRLHPVVTLLGLGRADIEKDREPADLPQEL